MALIICKNCGKKVSDTLKNCIHCGASLEEKEIAKKEVVEETKSSKKNNDTICIKFNNLKISEQLKLETDFINSDKKCYNFRRKELEFKKFYSIGEFMIIMSLLLFVGSRYVINKILDGKIFNEDLFIIGVYIIIALFIIGIITDIVTFVSKIVYNHSIKKYVYIKKFQLWLKDNKIEYTPILVDKDEKRLFEEIDLSTIDL